MTLLIFESIKKLLFKDLLYQSKSIKEYKLNHFFWQNVYFKKT